ncbi:MAG: peptidase domain-containing ABC transporter [Pseudomonadota bacterium]|nr:peptidase domain-containing ABC transporter [Pseudomonadota bacterium]
MANIGFEAIQFVLDTHIMFSMLPQSEKQQLQPLFTIKTVKPGEIIVRQGDQVDGMHVIYTGQARLKQLDEDGRIKSIGTVEEEGTIGEMSLLQPMEWPYTVVAIDTVTMLVLPADKARELTERNAVIAQHFKTYVSLIEVSYRLRDLLGKAEYERDKFFTLVRTIGVKAIGKGKPLFKQGDDDPRLYYVERGTFDLIRAPLDGDPIVLDRARHGSVIGEAAAIAGYQGKPGLHTYTARAATDTIVLVMPKDTMKEILEINPALHEQLADRIRELKGYEEDEAAIRKRAEGVNMRMKFATSVTENEFKAMQSKKTITTFPEVRQSEEAECAAACLTMVVNHYGKEFSLGQIRELTGIDGANITPDDVIRGAELMGFRAKAYSLQYEDLRATQMPAIIGWENYHYVTVYKVDDKSVHLVDPDGGKKIVPKKRFLASWSTPDIAGGVKPKESAGLVVALNPTQKFEKEEEPKKPILYFLNFILPHKKYFGEAFLAAVIINILGLASPLFVQAIVDTVVVHNDKSILNMMLLGMVVVSVSTMMMGVAQNLLLAFTVARIDMRMMSEFYRHVLSLPMEFFLKRNKGDILSRFGENQKIRAIITGSTVTVLLNTIMILIYFLMMFTYNVNLTIIVLVFLPIYIGIVVYFTPRIKRIAQEIFLTSAQSQAYLIESINGIETLKATANEYFARERWEQTMVDNINRSFQQRRLGLWSDSLFRLATLGSSILVLWYGANQVMLGAMSIGELMGFNMLMGLVTAPVLQMVNLWNQIQEIRIAIDRVGDVLTVKPEQLPVTNAEKMPSNVRQSEGQLTFEKVDFSYTTTDQTHLVMKAFDLQIEPGQHIALVGPSGCGKSTIAKMILGFHFPIEGRVLIDGKDMTQMDLYSLRRNIGVVLQDPFIFSGTVAENIGLGDPEPDMQAVKEAARLAGADEFIVNFPLGYQTPIGEKGVGLSGGQRQRVCIARALYRKPKIMIFDEATSALDNESEKRITKQLELVMHNRTSITIAHRLSTVVKSDVIYYIRDGKVREYGTHQQLVDPEYIKEMEFTGMYYALAQSQFDLPPLELESEAA